VAAGAVGSRSPTAASAPTARDWRALAASIDGDVIRRDDDGYHRVRRLFDPRFDGARPRAVVRAENADDVAELIGFARRFGLRCRPRAGGHSYVGASTVDDGIVIDVRRIRSVRYEPADGIATLGAGASTYRVHELLARHGRTVATGTCPTVGLAGLVLGGGLGIDSTALGLSCDALAGLRIVTADGAIRSVDAERDVDLWWASHGGGGGNFGVVTSMSLRTTAAQRMGVFSLSFGWRHAARAVRGWAARVEAMPRSVWCNLQLVVDAQGRRTVVVLGRCDAGDQDSQAEALERAVGADARDVTTGEQSFMDAVRAFGGGSTTPRSASVAGSDVVAGMTRSLSETLPRVVARRAHSGTVSRVILDPLAGAVRDQAVDATAFPWRRHLAELQWLVRLPTDPSRREIRSAREWVDGAHRAIAAESVGGYVNRLEPGRPLRAYYGANLARLRRIKEQVDPDGFFRSPYTV
jgi:FAD/FMN-containing dehydrogenase